MSLAIKFLLAPLLILSATMISRRWGPRAAGLFTGLPLTSGPISFVLFLQCGPAFAGMAAGGVLIGLEAVLVFCWVYARVARYTAMPIALLLSIIAYAATMVVLFIAPSLALLPSAALVSVTLVLALATLPPVRAPEAPVRRGELFDALVRMGLAASMVLVLTSLAAAMGPRLTGILSPFPLFAALMAGFTHQQDGVPAVIELVRGMLRSTSAFIVFFLVLALLLPNHVAAAYPSAIVVTLFFQAAIILASRWRRTKEEVGLLERRSSPAER